MKAQFCLAALLAFCVVVGNGMLTSTNDVTKVASIDLGFPASNKSRNGALYNFGSGEMYYAIQQNGTIVAVNLTSSTVAYHIDLPGGVGANIIQMGASKSGYLMVDVPDQRLTFDPKGKFVSSSNIGVASGFHQSGQDSLVFLTASGLSSLNLKTGKERVVLKGVTTHDAILEPGDWSQAQEGNTVVLTESGPLGTTKIFEYNYETNVTNWVIENINVNGGYRGQDATHVFARNDDNSNGNAYFLVYSKATGKKVAELKGYNNVGPMTPVTKGGLINIVSANEATKLDVVNMSTGVVVKQKQIHSPLARVGTHLVSWTEDFSVVSYPGGSTALNKVLSSSSYFPSFLAGLPGTDLVVGTFLNKLQVRHIKTGASVYEQPLANNAKAGANAMAPYISAERRMMVVTNGDKADVFQF